MLISKINDWVIIFLSFSILVAMAGLGYWDLLDGRVFNPVLEFGARSTNQTHMTEKLVYHPGEMVYARVLMQKNRSIEGVIQWHLIDDEVKTFPPRTGNLPIGVWDAKVRIETIPLESKPAAHYWFCGTVRYKINWLAYLTYNLWTNKFNVVKK